jgi:hypothetical protein
MSERIHALAQRLLGKASIEECDLQEVKNLVQRFPYFAPAQFLLLEKLKQENPTEYPAQLQKCILYYHNPLEFQYFISSDRFYTEVSLEEEVVSDQTLPTLSEVGNIVTSTDIQAESQEVKEISDNPSQEIPSLETETEPVEESPGPNLEPPVEELPVMEPPSSIPDSETPGLQPEPKTQFTFEPYHTVDYFASQGIKLSVDEAPKDKLGKQLKSFTEWLKTMKRISPTQMPVTSDTSSENKVQNLAQDSIHESSVWTEAMAEVWAKQGNTEKAIEVLNKLSLLNPSKKAYFATKIENLKRS